MTGGGPGRRLDNRIAAITAGTRSIGRGIAEAFLAQGASVVINGRSAEKGTAALDEITAADPAAVDRVAFYQGSATEQAVVEGLVDFAIERFGRLDIMVANAGGVGKSAPIMEMPDDEWQYELDLNLNHTFWAFRKALQHMVPRGSGRIIALSSVEGKHGKPRVAGYVANKHAINGLVKAVAREVGTSGVTVNAICPGIVVTDMLQESAGASLGLSGVDEVVELFVKDTALKRPVTIEEIAAFAVHLASDEGAGFTGGTISLDGGDAYY